MSDSPWVYLFSSLLSTLSSDVVDEEGSSGGCFGSRSKMDRSDGWLRIELPTAKLLSATGGRRRSRPQPDLRRRRAAAARRRPLSTISCSKRSASTARRRHPGDAAPTPVTQRLVYAWELSPACAARCTVKTIV